MYLTTGDSLYIKVLLKKYDREISNFPSEIIVLYISMANLLT